ncbi:thiamine pyrophosphate-binding protein [Noviherbaspirillum aerium]|uniref:thiamine pyrophosphate-binding protein n=1 Tax=Noviherbaspirillum aerium TaxID=2588497 RepID=UPI00124E930F|nr:thiamine pyrophosphate-binding protein [Noviherbaspirillum aerium]
MEGQLHDAADLIVAYLEQLGVEYVFGVPGGAIEPLYNALARSSRRGGPRPVLARHEAGAAFMADGYARETGKLGVCCGTSGPGATNMITGVACAYDNAIPMLVLTGQPALPNFGRRALQESSCTGIDIVAMFSHCTRYNTLVTHADQLEHKLVAALMHATRTPGGPAHLSIPLDILKAPLPRSGVAHDIKGMLKPAAMLDVQAADMLVAQLQEAKNPLLLIGGSCGEAIASLLDIAMHREAGFIVTPDAKGLIDPRHPLFRGVFGFAGHASAEMALRDKSVDLIVAFGASMNEWTSGGWSDAVLNHRLVHVDECEEHLVRTPMARLHVRGRIAAVAARLVERMQVPPAMPIPGPVLERPASDVRPQHRGVPPLSIHEGVNSDDPVKPQQLMQELGRLFPSHTRYLADSGNSFAWAIHYLSPEAPGSSDAPGGAPSAGKGGWLRVTMDFAPMGWAIGGAIGTALGNPDAPVVCITGDGSMLMNGQELSAAVAEELNVVFVVLNDAALGMVKHGQRLAGAERIAHQLPHTDFAALAHALGAQAHTIHCLQDLAGLDIDAIRERRGPTLLDVRIDAEEVPPMSLRMRVLGTAV